MKHAVQILYAEGCPHAGPTLERVQDLARGLGLSIDSKAVLIETAEDVLASKYLGSPTVLVNGVDIDPGARDQRSTGFS